MYHLQNNACGALEINIRNSGRGVYWSKIKAADIPVKARLWEQLESSKQTDKKKKKSLQLFQIHLIILLIWDD